MARRSSKRAQVLAVSSVPSGGIDYSSPPTDISSNYLRQSLNGYYLPFSQRWRTRPGIECVMSDANTLPASIRVIRSHSNGTATHLYAVSGTKLYRVSASDLSGGSPAFSEIGLDLIASSTVKAALCSYNSTLYIADGDTALKYVNPADSTGSVTNGPGKPTLAIEGRNRLWVNSGDEADGIYVSPAEWTSTDFDFDGATSGASLTLRAGYGDGLNVVSMCAGPGGNDIIVGKSSTDLGSKLFRRVDVSDSTPSNWFVSDPFVSGYAPQPNPYAMCSAFNDVVFVGDDGIHAVAGVQEYGDFKVNDFGRQINPFIRQSGTVTINEVSYSAKLGVLFFLFYGTPNIYVYHPWNGAFTRWKFGETTMNSMCEIAGSVYFASEDGRLYRLKDDTSGSESNGYDELECGAFTPIQSSLRSKSFAFGGYEGKVRRTSIRFDAIMGGSGSLVSIDSSETSSPLINFTIESGSNYIGDPENDVLLIGDDDASTGLIGDPSGEQNANKTAWGGPRSISVAFEATFTDGARVEVQELNAEIAAPLGV